jgi:hypothetical protein
MNGSVWIDLADGKGASALFATGDNNTNFDTALSTATTTISLAPASGSFNAGSVRVIGYK